MNLTLKALEHQQEVDRHMVAALNHSIETNRQQQQAVNSTSDVQLHTLQATQMRNNLALMSSLQSTAGKLREMQTRSIQALEGQEKQQLELQSKACIGKLGKKTVHL